ncbi:MAG: response regulator [Candidatus Saccharibacteria bacterium]|nr:response regulator [Candidatus Saccharibacteria bacterium]
MTKIMLVEDDKSLREIYGVRLLAEGYEIISAGDGEEALAMAVKEKPDLILSDVMMPKISGFDMLDILRSTPETKDVKVIMMTALSSEDQRARGETLGANRYLVKSQVGIEDVVRTVHDVLADVPVSAAPKIERFGVPAQTAAISQPVSVSPRPIAQPTTPAMAPEPIAQPNQPVAPETQSVAPSTPVAPTAAPAEPVAPVPEPTPEPVVPTETLSTIAPIPEPAVEPVVAPTPVPAPPVAAPTPPPVQPVATPAPAPVPTPPPTELPQPTAPFSSPAPASLGDRVINPITPTTPTPDIASMMNQELHDGSDTTPFNPQP